MTDAKTDRPKVFLSSVFEDTFGGIREYVPLRKQIIENKSALPVDLWAYDWPNASEDTDPDADTIIDHCFSGIRDADLFVFLLTGRHGSGVTYFEDPTYASYLELELFAAAALQKPILVLHQKGQSLEGSLHDTMLALKEGFAGRGYLIDSQAALYIQAVDQARDI